MNAISIADLLHDAEATLAKRSFIADPAFEAELLLSAATKQPREYLLTYPNATIDAASQNTFYNAVAQRAAGQPIAYITGRKEFYKIPLFIDKHVLIPRPETELLVEEALLYLRDGGMDAPVFVADIGTGSGCIAIAIAFHMPNAFISAVDISEAALKTAFKNILMHNLQDQIELLQGNLVEPLRNPVDLIVANLPYLPHGTPVSSDVGAEPSIALYSGGDGLQHIKELLQLLPGHVNKGARIFLEIHPPQARTLTRLVDSIIPRAHVEIKKDLSERDRVAVITLH